MGSIRKAAAAIAVSSALARGACASPGLAGFGSASASSEFQEERAFDASVDPAEMRSWLRQMSSAPNQVGSPHDRENAEFTLAKFRQWGWTARIETFYVLYPTPEAIGLELVAPFAFRARLAEPALAGDTTSAKTEGGLPPYNIFCADGDVTADLVYVNFGMPEDYAELGRRAIDVKGRIVIARYGGGWRGLKARLAQEHGALGCIIYSDPHEDGYWGGDAYPAGPRRPQDGVQRGSVADITLYSGDPLTPGVGATRDAKRLPIAEARTILKIPVLPISYGDARPLLEALTGPVAPPGWRGALPITYHVGPGPSRVHLTVKSDWGLKPIYDVIAEMPGYEYPDQWVLRGNHHDGWVFGAWDPLSGNVAVLAEAKAIGALAAAGWKPRRTIVYASWDGEEPGLLGSTEWAEAHAAELRRKAVLYVNSDTNARGLLFFGGSPEFEREVNEVAGAVVDPETGASVLARLRAATKVNAEALNPDSDYRALLSAARSGADLPLAALGSGSDYTPFLQHLGIASVNLGFSGEDDDAGIYHSTYDSFDHFVRFGDPKFAYEVALAQTAGRLVLRTADAEVIPMGFGALAGAVARYVSDAERLADREREEAATLRGLVAEGAFTLAADPEAHLVPPSSPAEVPAIDFRLLERAAARLKASALAYDGAFSRASAAGFRIPASERAALNSLLQGLEQTLLSARGLPGRGWYQHMLFAPGSYTGYGAKTLPAVREAIEQRRWSDLADYIPLVADAIGAASARIDQACTGLAPRPGVAAPPSVQPPPPSDT